MILKKLVINVTKTHKTNTYIIMDEFSKEGMIIDPAGEPERIIDMAKILGIKLKYIVLTHCHSDHTSAVPEVRFALGGKVLIHTSEKESVNNEDESLFYSLGIKEKYIEIDSRVNDGDILHLGDIEFEVIHTPGHTKGGICLYCPSENFLISGDTMFSGSWGRTDLKTSSINDIMASITNKLLVLPEDTIVYPRSWKIYHDKRRRKNLLELKTKEVLIKEIYKNY